MKLRAPLLTSLLIFLLPVCSAQAQVTIRVNKIGRAGAPARGGMRPGRDIAAAVTLLAALAYAPGAPAERAALIFDPDQGTVLFAEHANRPSYPASLTKLMTVYLVLETIDAGRLAFDQEVVVSKNAARQEPKKLGLVAGTRIRLDQVLLAIIVLSANDAAVVAADAVAGDETRFAARMSEKARALGMSRTTFRNASGLPDPAQVTTARDIAVLARALRRDFPAHFHLFAKTHFDYRGRRYEGHNNFVRGYRGSDGLKTGFTCRAGYNLAASAARDGRRLMGVVLGARTAVRRDGRMVRLFDAAYARAQATPVAPSLDALANAPDPKGAPNRGFIAEQCIDVGAGRVVGRAYGWVSGWSLEFGIEVERTLAMRSVRRFIRDHRATLRGGRPLLIPRVARDAVYQLAVTGLKQDNATATCRAVRDDNPYCVVRPPEAAKLALESARRSIAAARKRTKVNAGAGGVRTKRHRSDMLP